jgi:hypothetical protein
MAEGGRPWENPCRDPRLVILFGEEIIFNNKQSAGLQADASLSSVGSVGCAQDGQYTPSWSHPTQTHGYGYSGGSAIALWGKCPLPPKHVCYDKLS